MAIEFKLPELGENVTSGDVTRVLVKVGDTVKVDQSVLEMETGKATVEIPSTVAGVVTQIHVKEGSKAKVGQVILSLDGAAAAPAAAPKAEAPKKAPAPAPAAPAKNDAVAPQPVPVQVAPQPAVNVQRPVATLPPVPVVGLPPEGDARAVIAASPSTRKFAREIGVDVQSVAGTGPGGRISVDDVKNFSRALHAGAVATGAGRPVTPPLPDFGKWGQVERQPMSNIRIATAEHMNVSWSNIPHVTLHDKADLTDLEKLRQANKAKAESAGGKLTVTAFLIKILGAALRVHPNFNASIDIARKEIVLKNYYNVGVAVDTEKGLMVPVVRDIDRKTVFQIAADLSRISDKARAKKISPDDMQGGCITLTNLGGIGGTFFTPIVNFPEVAILGVGKASYEPVLVNGFFQPRLMMPLSLSFDHRVIDGADGARFMKWVIDAIQQPVLLSLEG